MLKFFYAKYKNKLVKTKKALEASSAGKGNLKKERKTVVVKTVNVQVRGKYFICEIRTDVI